MNNPVKKINSLGFFKHPKDTKVVVAMSGGVDSSTVAGLMKNEGYNVIGITLKLYNDTDSSKRKRQCCAGQDILDAKRVASKLDIKHKILYFQKKFKNDVIDPFVNSYVSGETPIPCIQCNQSVKFRDLYTFAKDLNADALVTGHYVKRIERNKRANMYRAADLERDQSYFLFSTTQEQLNFLRFPLGNIKKNDTRKIASKLNLNVAEKADSQDICFVPNGEYSSLIKKYKPKSFKAGDIFDVKGNNIGKHEGIINYTIGQRKGIRIAHKEALYVVDIDAKNNRIIVGPKEALSIKKIYLRDLNLLEDIKKNNNIFVKIRSTGKLIRAKIKIENDKTEVNLDEDEVGVSPGQACVFYSKTKLGDKVLGGGWITKTVNKYLST